MPAKQHLNFHGTMSTFVRRFHPSLSGAPVLNLPLLQLLEPCFLQREGEVSADKKGESISMFACVEEDRVS